MNPSIEGRRTAAGVLMLAALLAILAMTALTLGQVGLSLRAALQGLLFPHSDEVIAQIVREIRLPRILTALTCGVALGVAGVLIQALFRNPVADAWSLGLTAGGQLGVALLVAGAAFAGPAALSFLTGLKGIGLSVGAAVGVAAAAAIMLGLGRRLSSVSLLVVGLMIWFTAQGLVSVIMHFANRAGGRVFSGWNDGNFAGVDIADFPWLALPVIAGLVFAALSAKPLTSLLLGDNYARSLGVNLPRLRLWVMGATVLLVAPVTAYCGPVLFIGLIAPHFARAIAGTARIPPLLPLAGLVGAALALAADLVVHLPWDQHFLHLNAVLALIGAPTVILLLARSRVLRSYR